MEKRTAFSIVKETIDFYTANPDKRAAIEEKTSYQCRYLLPNGNMCAVGRCMIDPKENWTGACDQIGVAEKQFELEDLLKEEYKGHDQEMWKDLQGWHDAMSYWQHGKLSENGQTFADRILEKYKDR